METYKLSFAKGEFPKLFSLRFDRVPVSLRQVLLDGITPLGVGVSEAQIIDALTKALNQASLYIKPLQDLGYCTEVAPSRYYQDSYRMTHSLQFLTNVRDSVQFVKGDLSVEEVYQMGMDSLKKKWDSLTAANLLRSVCYKFTDQRNFLKQKKKGIKLRSYHDIHKLDLSKILSPEDFKDYEERILQAAWTYINFRKAEFLASVANEEGLLRLFPPLQSFRLFYEKASDPYRPPDDRLVYACTFQNALHDVHLQPWLHSEHGMQREYALKVAKEWGNADSFTFDISFSTLEKMMDSELFTIRFGDVDYSYPYSIKRRGSATATVVGKEIPTFEVQGRRIHQDWTGDEMKKLLRSESRPCSGVKSDLVKELAQLIADTYFWNEPSWKKFFRKNKYVRIPSGTRSHDFPVTKNPDNLVEQTALLLFIFKHLRASTILDATYENDSYSVLEMAEAFLLHNVNLHGSFVAVEERKRQ